MLRLFKSNKNNWINVSSATINKSAVGVHNILFRNLSTTNHKHSQHCQHHDNTNVQAKSANISLNDNIIVSSFTTEIPQNPEITSNNKVKSEETNAKFIPVPTPYHIRLTSKTTDEAIDDQGLYDADNPLITHTVTKDQVVIPHVSKIYAPRAFKIDTEATLSHRLLQDAGFIQEISPGHIVLLPLGYRVMKKITDTLELELYTRGFQGVNMPFMIPKKFWESTGRWETLRKDLVKALNSEGEEFGLASSQEEAFISLAKATMKSYEDLPVSLYQINKRIRDVPENKLGLLESREFTTQDGFSFASHHEEGHEQYKTMLEIYKRIFERLDVPVIQVESDNGNTGGNMSHSYHIPVANTKSTDALLKCHICGYTATSEKALFKIADKFDQAAHNQRLRSGNISQAMINDPRSVGLFPTPEERAKQEAMAPALLTKQKNMDATIRTTLSTIVKQVLPDLCRKDVPIIANLVRIKHNNPEEKEYDPYHGMEEADGQFKHNVLMFVRADREINLRAVCTYFDCDEAEIVPSSHAALTLLKYHKYKVEQHEKRKANGDLPKDHNNPFERMPTKHHKVDVEKMIDMEAKEDRAGMLAEQRRVERLNARLNIDGGMLIMADESLVADGMDIDSAGLEDYDVDYINQVNADRSKGHGMLEGDANTSLHEAMKKAATNDNRDESSAISRAEAAVSEASRSLSDLEEEFELPEDDPHILASTKWSPDLARAMGFEEDDSDNEFLSQLNTMTTVDPVQAEFALAKNGDICIQKDCHGHGTLTEQKSIEVAQLFYLADKYSSTMKVKHFDDEGEMKYIDMSSYTFGITRFMAAVIESEKGHDSNGITWPEPLAPYSVCVLGTGSINHPLPIKNGEVSGLVKYRKEVEEKRMIIRKSKNSLKLLMEKEKVKDTAKEKLEKFFTEHVNDKDESLIGLWDWGEAGNKLHSEQLATLLASSIPTLVGDIIIDDRYDLPLEQRVKTVNRWGVPYTIIIDDNFQTDGIVQIRHRRSGAVEYMNIDRLVAHFSGQIPIEERPEYNESEYNKALGAKVDRAIMRTMGLDSFHGGDHNYLKVDNNEIMYDYNERDHDVLMDDYVTSHQIDQLQKKDNDENEEFSKSQENQTKRDATNQLRSLLRNDKKETNETDELKETLSGSNPKAIDHIIPRDYYDMMGFLPMAPGVNKRRLEDSNVTKDKYAKLWVRIISLIRGSGLPSVSFDDIAVMKEIGIVYEPFPGVMRINENLAFANLHIMRGGFEIEYEYSGGANEQTGIALNLRKVVKRTLPSTPELAQKLSAKTLRGALEQPLNPPLTPLQVAKIKYALFGGVEDALTPINGCPKTAPKEPVKSRSFLKVKSPFAVNAYPVLTSEFSDVIDFYEDYSTSTPSASSSTSTSTSSPTSTSRSVKSAPSTSNPFHNNNKPVKRGLGLSSLVQNKYVTRETIAREVDSTIDENDYISGLTDSIKKRNLDGSVFYESSHDINQMFTGDVSSPGTGAINTKKSTKHITYRRFGKGSLSKIMTKFEEELEEEERNPTPQ